VVSAAMIVGVVAGAAPAERVRYYLLFESLVLGITAIVISNYVLDKHTGPYTTPSWFARWAGIIATLDISAFLAIILINITQKAQIPETTWHADKLSGVSYVILSIVFFLIIGGFGWCFYRAIMATSRNAPPQPQQEGEVTD